MKQHERQGLPFPEHLFIWSAYTNLMSSTSHLNLQSLPQGEPLAFRMGAPYVTHTVAGRVSVRFRVANETYYHETISQDFDNTGEPDYDAPDLIFYCPESLVRSAVGQTLQCQTVIYLQGYEPGLTAWYSIDVFDDSLPALNIGYAVDLDDEDADVGISVSAVTATPGLFLFYQGIPLGEGNVAVILLFREANIRTGIQGFNGSSPGSLRFTFPSYFFQNMIGRVPLVGNVWSFGDGRKELYGPLVKCKILP